MEELRLPWNGREGLLYGGLIALVTAFIMATFNIAQNNGGLDAGVLATSIKSLPLIWIIVMLLLNLVVLRAARFGIDRFADPQDGFNARILFNIVLCVTMMSAIMTLLGPLVGEIMSGGITWNCVGDWIHRWPINFFAAFWVELLIAQPFARKIMKTIHLRKMNKVPKTS